MDFETRMGLILLGIAVVMWIGYRISLNHTYVSNRSKRYVQPPRKSNDRRVGGVRHG